MVKHWFYTAEPLQQHAQIYLNEIQAKHAVLVLRLKPNDSVILINGLGYKATAIILETSKKNCIVRLHEVQYVTNPLPHIHIAIAPLKNTNRLEWFLEKVTEIGVREITLLNTHRTERSNIRIDRLEQIIIAAGLQAQQLYKPTLHNITDYTHFIAQKKEGNACIAHCLEAAKLPIKQFYNQPTTILIGPEGDFTEEEITLAVTNGWLAVTLGNSRLRTETAGIVAATQLLV
jgi:16S rRNA (uracil1498-N3)-methyltransferase